MAYQMEKVDVWLGFLKDKPEALAGALEVLKASGANLEFIFGRGMRGGKAIYFLAPIKGSPQLRAARKLHLTKSSKTLSLRITGPDKRGIGLEIARALGEAGINIRGFSAMGIGGKAMFYVALARKDMAGAQRVLKKAL
ncbi:MAG: hypothetical protein RAO92_00065 [Candidatus Euphemobacter frigidus]|nr:hypothetical protein [Candidatus Euphemobacter frigidus]MDP8274772.1 hypothetical protein [Candidatus Euphemobacter frigidus]